MEIFINERSLHSQFMEMQAVANAVASINRVLFRLVDVPLEKRVLFDPELYLRPTAQGHLFSGCLEQLPDKEVRLQFKRLLREHFSASSWRDEATQKVCAYVCRAIDVRDTSIAELAERNLHGNDGILLNFEFSDFSSEDCLTVVKEHNEAVVLHSLSSTAHLEQWAAAFPELGFGSYDPNGGRTPLDSETVLRDRSRFIKTKLKNQARAVYLERATGLYFCVDNLHEFAAHLEVFDAQGAHVGEANLNGVIDTGKADATKFLEN